MNIIITLTNLERDSPSALPDHILSFEAQQNVTVVHDPWIATRVPAFILGLGVDEVIPRLIPFTCYSTSKDI